MNLAFMGSDYTDFPGDKTKSSSKESEKNKFLNENTNAFCNGYSCDVNLSELVVCQTERTAHIILERLKNNNISAMSYSRTKKNPSTSKAISILVLDQYRQQALQIIRNLKKSLTDYTICDE